MLTTILTSLQPNVRLVVRIPDLRMLASFINVLSKYKITNSAVALSDQCIEVLDMKYGEYLKFMKDLQSNDMNLKEIDTNGMICELIKWKK